MWVTCRASARDSGGWRRRASMSRRYGLPLPPSLSHFPVSLSLVACSLLCSSLCTTARCAASGPHSLSLSPLTRTPDLPSLTTTPSSLATVAPQDVRVRQASQHAPTEPLSCCIGRLDGSGATGCARRRPPLGILARNDCSGTDLSFLLVLDFDSFSSEGGLWTRPSSPPRTPQARTGQKPRRMGNRTPRARTGRTRSPTPGCRGQACEGRPWVDGMGQGEG